MSASVEESIPEHVQRAERSRRSYEWPDELGVYSSPLINYEYAPSAHDPNYFEAVRMLSPEEVEDIRRAKAAECGAKCEAPGVRTALYRLRNSEGDLLYVGISSDPLRRWTEHAAGKEWGPEVSQFNIDWLACRCKALAAEAAAIRAEKPSCNVVHNTKRVT